MCDTDVDGPSAFAQEIRRARKDHRCCACGEAIRAGDRYQYTSGIWDHEPDSYKHCMRCARILEALPPGALLELNCGEVWDDPPEDIAALAFALPGEITTMWHEDQH